MTLRRLAQLLSLAVFILSVGLGATARADEPGIEEARARMEKGQKLFADEKFAEAEVEFTAAYKVQPYKAFLYNAAVAAEKGGDKDKAIAHYEEFVRSEPNAPDAVDIKATIERLKKQDQTAPIANTSVQQIRSLVVVLSDPKGAPVSIYYKLVPNAVFDPKKSEQAGWKRIATGLTTPADLSLPVGSYHITVEDFRDFKRSDTDLDLQVGTVYVYKAGLSQGSIIGKVQIKSPVAGAKIYVDDPAHKNAPIGATPATIDATPGAHTLYITQIGYDDWTQKVDVKQGEVVTVQADMARVKYGYLVIDANVEEMKLKVDGVSEGTHQHKDGPVKLRLDVGAHDVVVDSSGMNAFKQKVTVPGGQEQPVHVKLNESSGKGGGVAFSILAAGSFGGGAALFVVSGKEKDATTSKDEKYGAIGGMAGGGVFTGLAIFFFAYDPSEKSTVKLGGPREFDADTTAPADMPAKRTSSLKWTIAPMLGTTTGAQILGVF